MKSTYIKLDRNIKQWRWFKEPNTLLLWIYILVSANIKDNDFMQTTIKRGELATSYPNLSLSTGLTVNQVRTALAHLKDTGEVTVRKYSKFSVISVKNYDLYQCSSQANHSQTTGSSQANHSNQRMEESKKYNNMSVSNKNKESNKENNKTSKYNNKYIKNNSAHTQYDDFVTNKPFNTFGSFDNVVLTEDEYSALVEKYPKITQEIIEQLSESIAVNPDKYKTNHYAWCLKFARNYKPPQGSNESKYRVLRVGDEDD